MKISFVAAHFYPSIFYGGPISVTWDLSNSLSDKDFDIYVSTTNANGLERLEVEKNTYVKIKDNFHVKYYHEERINSISLAFIFGIYNDLRNADYVYIQYIFHYTVFFALFFSYFLKKKVVISPRGSISEYGLSNKKKFLKKIWLKFLVFPFLSLIDWHACSSNEELSLRNIFPKSKIHVINDSIDFNSFQNSEVFSKVDLISKYTNRVPKSVSNIFFSMGRLHSVKRFDVLINAFSIFIKSNKNSKLIIAGADYGVEDSLRRQIKNNNLEDSIFLIGSVNFNDKKILLNNCDYFTLASDYESFGIVIAEALACGKPIIASNKTPWNDLEQNKCGIFVTNDKNSFSKAFTDILEMNFDSKLIKNYAKMNFDNSVSTNGFIQKIFI